MADTRRTLAALQALLADNTSQDISPQDVRDMLVSCFPTGMRLLATATASGAATIPIVSRNADYESGDLFQSDFDVYVFEMQHIVPATNDTHLGYQFTSNGGSSWITTGYGYGDHYSASGNDHGVLNSSQVTTAQAVMATNISTNADFGGYSGTLKVTSPLNSTYYQPSFAHGGYLHTNGQFYQFLHSCWYSGAHATVNGIRFLYTSGNVSGAVQVYGLVK
jgi:hypothetical protein